MQSLLLLPLLLHSIWAQEWELTFKTHPQVISTKWISRGDGAICDILSWMEHETHRLAYERQELVINTLPLIHEIEPLEDQHHHDYDPSADYVITAYAPTEEQINTYLKASCQVINFLPEIKSVTNNNVDVVREIIKNGDSSNRIDVVLMGDGYRQQDAVLMEQDMTRLVNEMWGDVTFSAYLPVFNIWSVFRASTEQGIGTGGRPKNTAFGLYRDGTELRGIYCSKAADARDACRSTGPNACDFPSLIGNDPYYGGLGGEFTISTSSRSSGTLVLRHEMGHNFINVGEEYDGGSVYSGVNHSPLRNGANVPWTAWLTEPTAPTIQDAEIRVQEYPWYNLGLGQWAINFTSNGNFSRYLLRYSISGCEVNGSIAITLDGVNIPWVTRGTLDRYLEEVFSPNRLANGTHTLVFRQLIPPNASAPIRQLCSVTLHEWKPEPNFHSDNSYVAAYPTWRQGKVLVGYRPTSEGCLMRNMSSVRFCSPCYEGMWKQFFAKMSAIDSVTVTCQANNLGVNLATPKLGQLRQGGAQPGEFLSVRWSRGNTSLNEYNDQFIFNAPKNLSGASWRVVVSYQTALVRSDPNNILRFERTWNVPTCN